MTTRDFILLVLAITIGTLIAGAIIAKIAGTARSKRAIRKFHHELDHRTLRIEAGHESTNS